MLAVSELSRGGRGDVAAAPAMTLAQQAGREHDGTPTATQTHPARADLISTYEPAHWRTERVRGPVTTVRGPLPADLFRDLPDHRGAGGPVGAGRGRWRAARRHHQLRRHLRGPGVADQSGPRCPRWPCRPRPVPDGPGGRPVHLAGDRGLAP